MSDDKMVTYLESNPRMIGVLFALTALLSQAGNVAAAGGCIQGP